MNDERMPYPPTIGSTHYEGCYRDRGHHNCAVAEVDRLRKALSEGADMIREHVNADLAARIEKDPTRNE